MNSELSAGFADPVSDAQCCFRAVLDAMARPGEMHRVGGVAAPAPLCDAAGAVLLTLVDHETPLWLDPAAASATPWITFHTGAPFVLASQAAFAVALSMPAIADLPPGTDEMPETSATVILQVASLGTGKRFLLDGPGLRQPRIVAVGGFSPDFVTIWQRNNGRYPRGVDLILCAGNRIAALPRGVRVREA